jgi:8-amino-7-oxononanoate synthase
MRVDVHTSIAPIRETWDRLAPRGQVVLESAHLDAIERSGVNEIEPYYLIVRDGERPAGIAHCFAMRLDLAALEKDISPEALAALRSWNSDFMNVRVLECGIVSGLGRAVAAARPAQLGDVCRAVASEMDRIARDAGAEFVLVRDIPYGMLGEHEAFLHAGYAPLLGFPIATMPVRWKSFDEYLAGLTSAKRNRVRHYLSHPAPDLEVECLHDFGAHADRFAELWGQTNAKAGDYKHEVLSPAYFREIGHCLGPRCHAIVLKRHGEILAFGLILLGDDEYFFVHVGLDYTAADCDNLYVRLCLAILQDALGRPCRSINWGITTYDFKFERGFEAAPMVYLVKHVAQPRLTVALARGLQAAIKQPENLHRPFRDQDVSQRPDWPALASSLPVVTPPPAAHDVFSKVHAYDRPDSLKVAGIYSFFPPFESSQGPTVRFQGRDVVMLGSNAYLGLGAHPKVVAAAKAALDKYGSGCSGSPLLNGTLDIHLALARSLAAFMGKEDAILCSTGYQTNLGVVSALLTKDDVVVMDQFDHASLVDGARLAGAQIVRFRHNDMESLEDMLRAHPLRGKLVVVDSVFSMEGTVADLPTIVALARKYGARTMVDEAHAIGVLGPGGRGAAELLGVLDDVDIVMGTFSKSFASIGGFVAGDAKVVDYLRHVARSHMFSASLPPAAVAAVGAALEIIEGEPERRRNLLRNAAYMSRGLQALGYDAPYHQTAIVPVHCGSDVMALGAYKRMLDKGVFVNPVLHPAVPKGRELLRTSYMATHTREMLDRALGVFAQARTPAYPRATVVRSRPGHAAPPPLRVRPLVLLPVADRSSLAQFYAVASQHPVLRVPGFTRLDLGQPIDCGISLGQEGVKLQYPGVVTSKCLAPQPGRPLGIEVALLQSPDGTRDLIERLLAGDVIPPVGRHCWRYHAEIGVEWALDAEPQLDALEDISLEGAAILSPRDPDLGSRLPLRLQANQGAPIELAGEVRWRRQGERPAFGVRFRFSDTQERDRVRALVERIKTASADPPAVSVALH